MEQRISILDPADRAFQTWFLPCAMGAFSLIAYAWLTFGLQQVKAGEPIAIVFPPHWQSGDVFRASAMLEVDIVTSGSFDFVMIVVPRTDHALEPLRKTGALFKMKTTVRQLCTDGSIVS